MDDQTPPPDEPGLGTTDFVEEKSVSALGPEFARWMQQQFFPKKGRSVLKVDLYHLGAGQTFVRKWDESELNGGGPAIVAEIHETAEQDSTPMSGVQTYAVIVTFTDSRKDPPVRRLFHVQGGENEAKMALGPSEGATPQGFAAMAMRHANAATEMLLRSNQAVIKQLGDMVVEANRRAERVETNQLEIIRVHTDLLHRKEERDFELEDKRSMRELRNGVLGQAATALLPALVPAINGIAQKLAPAPAAPQQDPKVTEVLQALVSFITVLDQNAFAAMLSALPDDKQRQSLLNLVQKVTQAQEPAKPPPEPTPTT